MIELLDGDLSGSALVIAPHSDDEVLGAGGAIQRHLRRGERVTVVLLTNGDGQYRGPFKSRAQAIRFGLHRQEETRRALAHLGGSSRQMRIVFLGYPDRGLARLWNGHWEPEHLYTSPQTRLNHSPYENSFTPYAPYCGWSVVQDLQAILEDERPQIIYLPHPHDAHPDHWSAYAFTIYALEHLKLSHPHEESFKRARLLTYLVHHGRWPLPWGKFLRAELRPPRPLINLDIRWRSIPLTREETLRKYQAILRYRSQVRYMRPYLVSFARRNELFGEIPALRLEDAIGFSEGGSFRQLYDLRAVPEEHPLLCYLDPKQRVLLRNLRGDNAIQAVNLIRTTDERLVIEVALRRALRPLHGVFVHLKTIGEDGSAPLKWELPPEASGRLLVNGVPLRDERFNYGARWLRLSLPFKELGEPRAFLIGVELKRKGLTLARSAYRLVEVSPRSAAITVKPSCTTVKGVQYPASS